MPSDDSRDSSKSPSKKKTNKKKKKPSNKGDKSKKKKKDHKKKDDDDKSSSLPFSWLPSSSRNALPPPLSNIKTNNGVIIGAAIGAVLLLLFMITCMVCCCCRKKKRKQKYDKDHHDDIKDNGYYNTQHTLNKHQQSNDLHLKMPPRPQSGPASSQQQWVAAPPPPPPPLTSSFEMSSSRYSGPYQAPLPPPHPGIALTVNTNAFTYDDLATATKGFDQSLLLGQGGFGYVHKGVLTNGKEVAVKSLKLDSGQGERDGCPVIDCSTRLQIALGAAKGFAYLHEDCNPRIIHRDIKAANILIDEHYEAKVADFGLAKMYLAPEYASTGKLTEKSDVFSFGVVLLELITGKQPINRHSNSDEDNLIDWARPILMHASNGGSFEELVDPLLEDKYDRDEMHHMVACAASAIRHSAKMRPKMRQIVRVLEGDVSLDDLNEVGKNMRKGEPDVVDYDSHSYNGDIKRHKMGSMSSDEFSSNEHGMTK
ncbi:hypothetical protein L1987_39922 [Smallanthus sonchifolius]|uniref:Uncharacterized protein n=1 Tax=Smallanthus sonchifolius TaxID=185202 RepID=A0ACB9GS12_9ASTR|nr:hypothetical protein L1987_39922 [Smallanthus sonchifolius]